MFFSWRVEDRKDSILQKMRRYIKTFPKKHRNEENEDQEKFDTSKESPVLRTKSKESINRKVKASWEMIRNSALCLEMEMEESKEDQNIRIV